ncbi:unnamed protein product [Acanthosepion pharaonis]|uniref:Transmembrane protein n=1 Tax=Acanthosepion pharaonis TaxID=158019 RepID=A0A812E5M4_ACAPH|nr:unnamed protein product [Sepia pharaonis]
MSFFNERCRKEHLTRDWQSHSPRDIAWISISLSLSLSLSLSFSLLFRLLSSIGKLRQSAPLSHFLPVLWINVCEFQVALADILKARGRMVYWALSDDQLTIFPASSFLAFSFFFLFFFFFFCYVAFCNTRYFYHSLFSLSFSFSSYLLLVIIFFLFLYLLFFSLSLSYLFLSPFFSPPPFFLRSSFSCTVFLSLFK